MLYLIGMEQTPSLVEQTLKVREWIATGRARELRELAGLSRAAVGRDCEVDQQTVMRWERGTIPQGRNISAYYRLLARLESTTGRAVTAELAQV